MYEFTLLENPPQRESYETLTFPYYRSLLQKLGEVDTGILALGVCKGDEPVGLVLAVYNEDKEKSQKYADIKSLYIKPEHRCQGLGTNLLQKLECELQQRGCNNIRLIHKENPSTKIINSLLVKSGWKALENTTVLIYCSAEKVRKAPSPHLVQRAEEFRKKLSAKYEIFPWTELKESEKEAIQERMKTDNLWLKFNPFIGGNLMNRVSSYGVRYEERVVGWTISHNMIPNQTTFTEMFVTPECPLRPRIALPLMAKAINSLVESGCPKATFCTETSNAPMLKFIDRWLTPYIDNIHRVWSSEKVLDF
jgi:GNAT superfamily N-acetyltransferase